MCVFVLLLALSCLAQCLHVHGFSHYKQVSNIKLSQTYLSSKQKYVHPKSSFMMISHRNPDLKQQIFSPSTISKSIEIIWKFTRPHTIIGSSVSIISLYLYSIPVSLWSSNLVWSSIIMAAIPSLFMNLYITGLNQVFDVQIDEVNKPYLPMASKELSKPAGIAIVLISLLLSYLTTDLSQWPLVMTLVGSWFFGTIYSVPPFRLKRFPLLAALCILVVRGFLINIGFFLHAKIQVLGLSIPNLVRGIKSFPESVLVSLFFVVFGIVIAFLKDVPDIEGDEKFNIPSLSVQYGAKSIFR